MPGKRKISPPVRSEHADSSGGGKAVNAARARVLAEWRGVDLGPLEKTRAATARPAASVMPGLIKELRLESRRAEAELIRVWNEAIDPAVCAHAQPVGLRNGTLFVDVDSNVWLSEIVRYRRREILQRLQYSFGAELVKRISFRVG